jgi:P27 family predicted phage terminase small subunit
VVGRIDADAEPPPPPPPEHLSESAAERWRDITSRWLFSPSELVLLEEGLAAWDRVRDCRETLRREGFVLVNPDSGNPKRHPAAREVAQSLSELRQCWRQLGLDGQEEA